MLDLAFVRANLPLVEEKLRARGQDPAALLGDFHAVDAHRRGRITEVEQLKAQRNKLSEEVARLKKSGQDATAVMEETRAPKRRTAERESIAGDCEKELKAKLPQIPNLIRDEVPIGRSEEQNVEAKRWGTPPDFSF